MLAGSNAGPAVSPRASVQVRPPAPQDALQAAVHERAAGRCECRGQCGAHKGGRCWTLEGQKLLFESGKERFTFALMVRRRKPTEDKHLRWVCAGCSAHWNPWRAEADRRAEASLTTDISVYYRHLGGTDEPRRGTE